SDAPAVVESFAAAVDRVAVDVEAEQTAPGDEERTSLVEERLVGREIEHRWIRLDLSEVRVYRRIERQIGRDAVLHVPAGSHVRSLAKAVVDDLRRVLGDDVGHRLEPARRFQIVHPVQRSELRDEAGFRLPQQWPAETLLIPIEKAVDGHPESVLARPAIAHLREWNPEFGGPAEGIDAGGDIPDGIPGEIFVAVVVNGGVHFYAGRIDAELVAGAPVMVGVDEEPNHVGRRKTVTSFEQFDDTIWVGVERSHEHIQIRRVVRDPRFGLE